MKNGKGDLEKISEIINGYSEMVVRGAEVFLKHFRVVDYGVISKIEKKYLEKAIKRGMPTEKELLETANKEELWTAEEEENYKELRDRLVMEKKALSQMPNRVFYASKEEEIEKLAEEFMEAEKERRKFITGTAEKYAEKVAMENFLVGFLFKDRELTEKMYSQEEYDELGPNEINEIYVQFADVSNEFSNEEIQRLILTDEYSLFLRLADDPFSMFCQPYYKLTSFQLKMIGSARYFLSIFQNVDDIPDGIRKDPEALVNFTEAQFNKNSNKTTNSGKQSKQIGHTGMLSTDEETDKIMAKARRKKGDGPITMDDMIKMAQEGR
jgi:hypothetical protein